MTMEKEGTMGFSQRLADVFGNLHADGAEPSTAAATWQPSSEQVFRGGDTMESSEEEEEVQEDLELPEDLLEMSDAPGQEPFRPTGAFCRALDREDEYDATDHLATGRDEPDERPAGSTEVLPGNAYEPDSEGAAGTGDMQADADAAQTPPAFSAGGEPPIREASPPAMSSRRNSSDCKRVRFAAYVPPQRRSSSEGQRPEQAGSGLKPSLKPGLAAGPTSITGRQSTSSVPEHVRRPDAFDCYVLDEPLVVGGGDRSANERPQSQVTIEEVAEPASMEEDRAETRFGSGIEFRPKPRTADNHVPRPQAAASTPPAGSSAALGPSFLQDEALEAEEAGASGAVEPMEASTAAAKAPRQRRYRKAEGTLE